ncbi:hypothetical protein GHT89_16640 [Acinetobacter baumannii]|uniref:hypothetical protein n=1 Tax=Acinetobacter baumannii TaxID=470 RepID=UPI00387DC803
MRDYGLLFRVLLVSLTSLLLEAMFLMYGWNQVFHVIFGVKEILYIHSLAILAVLTVPLSGVSGRAGLILTSNYLLRKVISQFSDRTGFEVTETDLDIIDYEFYLYKIKGILAMFVILFIITKFL